MLLGSHVTDLYMYDLPFLGHRAVQHLFWFPSHLQYRMV